MQETHAADTEAVKPAPREHSLMKGWSLFMAPEGGSSRRGVANGCSLPVAAPILGAACCLSKGLGVAATELII